MLRQQFLIGLILTTIGLGTTLTACTSTAGNSAASGMGAPCTTTTDCPNGQACIVVGNVGACALSCSASGNECSGQASCSGVGGISANFCQRPAPSSMSSDSGMTTPRAEEQPRIPCRNDRECAAIHPSAVCARFQNTFDCTIPCTARSQCNPQSIPGIIIDFNQCAPDESNTSRTVCLPDPACFGSNPLACITIQQNPQIPDSGFPFDPEDAGF